MKSRLKVNTGGLTPGALLKRLKVHHEGAKNNPTFAGNTALLDKLVDKTATLESRLIQQELANQRVQEAAMLVDESYYEAIALIDDFAHEVSLHLKTNPNIAVEVGFEMADNNKTSSKINPPQHLSLSESNGTGKIKAVVQRTKFAKGYIIQINYDITDSMAWHTILNSTRAKNELVGLVPGKRVWVRVAALGAAGQSDWSDVASRIVP